MKKGDHLESSFENSWNFDCPGRSGLVLAGDQCIAGKLYDRRSTMGRQWRNRNAGGRWILLVRKTQQIRSYDGGHSNW
jgi:hypothetical protein